MAALTYYTADMVRALPADGEQDALADEEPEYAGLRDLLRKAIRQMREEGLNRPEMFVDKPVDPQDFVLKVKELIGE